MARKPRKPLPEPRTPPSARHPHGLPRCRRMRFRDGGWVQCKHPSAWRLNLPTCGSHGAGYAIRVSRGLRSNPALASIEHGRRATAATIAAALRNPATERLVAGAFFSQEMRRIEKTVAAKAKRIRNQFATRRRGRPTTAEAYRRRTRWAGAMLDEELARATSNRTDGQ